MLKENTMKNNTKSNTKSNTYIEDILEEYIPKVTCDITPYANRYEINFKKPIDDSEDYQELMSLIRQASPHDVVEVYLETCGGRLDVGLQLIDELNRCPAQKVCYVSSGTASMGTIIFLAVEWDIVDVSPLSTFHFHSVSYGSIGKHQDNIERVDHIQKLTGRIYDKYYKGVLTDKQIEDITKNKAELSILGEDLMVAVKAKHQAMLAEANGLPDDVEDLEGMTVLPTYEEVMKMKKLDLQELFIELFDLSESVDNKEEVE